MYGPEVDGAHSTFLQFALDKLRQGLEFKAFADQTLPTQFMGCIALRKNVASILKKILKSLCRYF